MRVDAPVAFSGAKIALLNQNRVLTYLRDSFDHIPWPDHWDLPGGGRENNEAPDECALRELFEEFGLRMDAARIIWRCDYPSWSNPETKSFFMAARIADGEIEKIQFGSEGQRWEMMPTQAFLTHERAVPHLKTRLQDFLRVL